MGRDGARPLRGEREWTDGGVWSPCPTGATQVMPSNGPMYLRYSFRQPNSEAEFGASVMGIGPYALRGTRDGGRHAGVVVPYGWLRRAAAIALGSGAQRSVCGADGRNRVESEAEIIPKVSINFGQSLSHGLWPCQLPLHKGAFGTGDADCRVASLLAMTVLNLCHSEEAQRADVGIRPFSDGRWFGPPRSSAPTEGLPKSQQRADVGIGPYGTKREPAAIARAAL